MNHVSGQLLHNLVLAWIKRDKKCQGKLSLLLEELRDVELPVYDSLRLVKHLCVSSMTLSPTNATELRLWGDANSLSEVSVHSVCHVLF